MVHRAHKAVCRDIYGEMIANKMASLNTKYQSDSR